MDSNNQMSRYARQTIVPEIGIEGQSKLSSARVLVVGAGGLAAPLLPILVGAGVGHITLIDGDTIDKSNLHRQTLFTEADCGQFKVEVAANRCRQLNSEIEIIPQCQALTPANAPLLVANTDLVLDCADSYAVSYALSDVCLAQKKPLISASVLGLSGYVGGFCGNVPSLRAVFPHAPDSGASCASAGVLGSVVAMVAAMQAQMALAVLLELTPSPLGQIVQIDARQLRTSTFRFEQAPEPTEIYPFVALSQLSNNDFIVELRDAVETPKLIHPTAKRIAPADVLNTLPTSKARVVLCCATGLRSWRVAEQIRLYYQGDIVLLAATAS